MTTVKVFAPAKINLALHVTGRRSDGFHEIDTLVVFADIGDLITIRESDRRDLKVTGPERKDVPRDVTNSVIQVAASFWHDSPLAISIEKNLPALAGIGGGSADAAACFRSLARLSTLRTDKPPVVMADLRALSVLARLGADIPMCLLSMPTRAKGIGDQVMPIENFPPLPAVLANPRTPVTTRDIFETLQRRSNDPMPELPPETDSVIDLSAWLGFQRNDLQETACLHAPEIETALDVIGQSKKVLLHRMSGSGATCFGIYPTRAAAIDAAAEISMAYPKWWVQATTLGDQSDAVEPHII